MSKLCVLTLCVLFVLSVSLVEGKRSGSRKPSSSSSSSTSNTRRHQDNRSKNSTSGFGGSHGGSNQHFLDSERHDTNNRGHIGFEKYNNPSQANPGGFGQSNYKPSAPVAGAPNQGIGSAFGGANYPPKTQNTHVQSAPYPTNNNQGGFGSNPGGHQSPGGFGSNPGGYNQPGGFGNNPAGGHYNQPGGFGNNPAGGHNQPGGFGNNPAGGHYNQPGGFGNNPAGGHYNQPGGFGNNPGQQGFGSNPAGGHYNQQPGGFGQQNYGGNTHGSQYPGGSFGGQPNYQSGGYGHQQSYPGGYNNFGGGHGYPAGSHGGYNPGGYGGHNPGGFGGGYGGHNPGGFGGGYGGYQQGGMYPGGGYKQNSGPGFGTGILGGAAGALPLGLLLGYGLGSMTSSSHSSSSSSPAAATPFAAGAAAPGSNDAYNTWLQQRTEEKKQEIAAKTGGDVKTINQTEIMNQILNETQMCPGGAGILDTSIINTMVPCNVTQVDFNVVNVTEPVENDCKSLTLSIVQINTATNENKTVSLEVKQNNVTGSNEFVVLSYDVEIVACTTPIHNPDGKLCATRSFTADPYHVLNETMSYLNTVNISVTQFNTTLNNNCSATGACGPDSKPPRNLTSSFISFSILPEYPLNVMLHQCMIFKTNVCDPASTTPCEIPPVTSKQTINTNTTLSKADFAYVNFVLHQSSDVFLAYTPPPAPVAENSGSSSSLTDSTTKSSATTI